MEILNEYGADAMRLYLITSPVVHGDNLAFKKQGVFEVVRSVFLPWYNAYRFLVQNAIRHERETGTSFDPAKVGPQTNSQVSYLLPQCGVFQNLPLSSQHSSLLFANCNIGFNNS